MTTNYRLAISTDLLDCLIDLSKEIQRKVKNLIEKFNLNQNSAGINLERVRGNLYTMRVDVNHRAVVCKPERGNTLMLMRVNSHTDAYRWIERNHVRVNTESGAIQVYSTEAVTEARQAETRAATGRGRFAAVKDKHLMKLGVPEELLPLVRAVETDGEVEGLEKKLPTEAFEALYLLAGGESLESVFREMDKSEDDATVDPEDFDRALDHPDSLRRFHMVEDARELSEILNAPLEKWRVFLHPKQRRLVGMDANGPVRVLGGAGTGKTVVAMHRAKHLALEAASGDGKERVLVTTFTRNLASDIENNLKGICDAALMKRRLEVVNLDRWVSGFLKDLGVPHQAVEMHDAEKRDGFWSAAMALSDPALGLSPHFYRQEWEHVVQAQGIQDLEGYMKASRAGRGTKIDRKARKAVWAVFEEYRAQLRENGCREYVDLYRDARQKIESGGIRLPYRSIVVDEAQDFHAEAMRLLRVMVAPGKNDLFIVGDAHQRIYRNRVALGRCGIDIRGRGRKLKINYRTTEEIRRFAVRMLEGRRIDDLDGGTDDQKGFRSLMRGVSPQVVACKDFEAEVKAILAHVKALVAEGVTPAEICLCAKTRNLRDMYAPRLKGAKFDVHTVDKESADAREKPGIRLATMHRVKGLEFRHMIIAAVNDGVLPWREELLDTADEAEREALETHERSLLYVAATRAREGVLITGYGKMSGLVGTQG